MKKTLMAFAATLAMSTAAFAADLPSRKAAPAFVPPPPVMTWNGFYVGANVGGSWKEGQSSSALVPLATPVYNKDGALVTSGSGIVSNSTVGSAGISGGLQAGYNWQVSPMFVVGAETDFQGTSLGSGGNGNSAGQALALNSVGFGDTVWAGTSAANQLQWFGTVRGRVGVVPLTPALMVYGTGGFAYGQVQRVNGLTAQNAVQTGWTAGGGLEYKLTNNWSVKGEYLYTQLSGNNQNNWVNAGIGVNNVNNKTTFQTVRAGLNYNFATETLPTLAKY